MKEVIGGVCAAKGFQASGIHCGLRKNPIKKDLALIMSDVPCNMALVATQNKVQAAPVKVSKAHSISQTAQAILCNSGNANACTPNGMEIAQAMCDIAGEALGIPSTEVLVASTGVIGKPLDITPIKSHMSQLVAELSCNNSSNCAEAIMTTDIASKSLAVSVEVDGTAVTIGGIGKGSGMIQPNMATMLGFITTDAAISSPVLQKALHTITNLTFNMVSVDGDTSTNDMVMVLANGQAENPEILENTPAYDAFYQGLLTVCTHLAKAIAKDGEGATKLLECTVSGATTLKDAQVLAKSVIMSDLFKSAMFGEDANWGRVLCALGYSGAELDPSQVQVEFHSQAGEVLVCQEGNYVDFSEELASKVLHEPEIQIVIGVGQGDHSATAWGCDLTYDYVKINGDYRS